MKGQQADTGFENKKTSLPVLYVLDLISINSTLLPRQLNTAKDLRGFLAHTKEVTSPCTRKKAGRPKGDFAKQSAELAHKASKTALTRV